MIVTCEYCTWSGPETDASREDLTPYERHLRTVHSEEILRNSADAEAANLACIQMLRTIENDQHARGVSRYAAHITAGLPCCTTTQEVTP